MAASAVTTVAAYLTSLPPDRRATVATVREVVNRHLPAGFVESMGYGMIAWAVPLERFPGTYNRQPLTVAALASQKSGLSLYLMGVYGHPGLAAWFRDAYARSGKKLDMGKSCVRFRTADDLPLALIGETIAKVSVDDMIGWHEAAHGKAAVAARRQARAEAPPARAAKPPAKAAKAAKPPARAAKPPAKAAKPTRAAKPTSAAKPVRVAASKPATKKAATSRRASRR